MSISTANTVCIILATYNPDLVFLRKQIDSIRGQTHTNWQCLLSDDCSNPEKFAACKELIANDPRFQLLRSEINLGSANNFEMGLSYAYQNIQSEFIALCDQDDIWEPFKLQVLLEQMLHSPQCILVHSDLSLIDANDQLVAPSCWAKECRDLSEINFLSLVNRNVVTGCSMMFRKSLLKTALPMVKLPFPPPYHHDVWLALHALCVGQIFSCKQTLVRYRQHANNVVGASVQKFALSNWISKILNWQNLQQKTIRAFSQRAQMVNDFLTALNTESAAQARPQLEVYLKPVTFNKCLRLFYFVMRSSGCCLPRLRNGWQQLLGMFILLLRGEGK